MKPVEFKEQNVVIGKDQKEYMPLPALKFEDGTVITCWKLSWKEVLKLVLTRTVWLSMLTFNMPVQPIFFTVKKKELFTTNNKK